MVVSILILQRSGIVIIFSAYKYYCDRCYRLIKFQYNSTSMKFSTPGKPGIIFLVASLLTAGFVFASTKENTSVHFLPGHEFTDTTKKDTSKFTTYKDLPLKPTRKISYTTSEGTWISLDMSPDGSSIVFDLMGDIYTIPATGGSATPVTTGLSFDTHPRYSPDGKKILFTSDRSGSENLWYIDIEKKDTVQVTKDQDQNFAAATWTPDGNYIISSRGRLDVKLWMYHKDGGGGIQLVETPGLKTIDPAVSADGRYVYFSQRNGA